MLTRRSSPLPLLLLTCAATLACGRVAATIELPTPRAELDATPREAQPLFVDIFVVDDYGCALSRDGQVWCWGADPASRLDLRSPSESWEQATVIPELGAVVAIDGDELTTCALIADGQVRCWQGPTRSRQAGYAPELLPGVSDAVQIEVAGDVCIRTREGEVHCSTLRGENRRKLASAAIDFAVSEERACALDADGGVWCWDAFADFILEGDPVWAGTLEQGPDQELLMARIPGAVQIEVGEINGDLLVRLDAGEILVEPTVEPELALPLTRYLPIPGAEHAQAFAFGEHGCIVARPGPDHSEVRCFRGNAWAQLGAGDSQSHAQAVTVPGLDGAHAVAASRSLSCALTASGAACWGTRMPDASVEAPRVLATEVASVAVTYFNTCASMLDGRNLCWGSTGLRGFERDELGIFAAAAPRELGLELGRLRNGYEFGYLDQAKLLLVTEPRTWTFGGEREPQLRREGVRAWAQGEQLCLIADQGLRCEDDHGGVLAVPELRKPTGLAAAGSTICVIHDRGKLGCFELADAPVEGEGAVAAPAPALLEIPDRSDTVQVIGPGHSSRRCYGALDRAGIVHVYCLGPGPGAPTLQDLGELSLKSIEQIVYTQQGICGRTRAGKIECERYRDRELVTHDVEDVVEISALGNHLCALAADGTLTCMGDNRWGQLGTVPSTVMATPVQIRFE